MHAAFAAEFALGILADRGRQLDLLAVQILRGDLRQPIDLALQRLVEARIRISEIHRRIPHLQIEERRAGAVIDKGPFAALEQFWRLAVMHRVAMRAVARLELQEAAFLLGGKIA